MRQLHYLKAYKMNMQAILNEKQFKDLKPGSLISIDIYDMRLENAIAVILGRHKKCLTLYKVLSNGLVFYVHNIEIKEIHNVI